MFISPKMNTLTNWQGLNIGEDDEVEDSSTSDSYDVVPSGSLMVLQQEARRRQIRQRDLSPGQVDIRVDIMKM